MRYRYRTAVLAACGVLAVTQAAVGVASAEHPASAEEVTISVSNFPPTTEEETREAFLQRVEEFEAQYPNITVEPDEWEYDVSTFAAQLAGGTLPTVFQIPFTDIQGLLQRGQVADITAEVEALPYAADFNPNVLAVAQDAERRDLRRAGRRLRHRSALQPGDVRGGRARPRRPADDVGRGA